jgi:uroporphyrinogen decarboxylase
MTPRERVHESLNHRATDKIPFGIGFGVNLPVKAEMCKYLHMNTIDQVDEYIDSFCDLKWVSAGYNGPTDRNTRLRDGSSVDIWSVVRKPVDYGMGYYDEIALYPLQGVKDIADLNKFEWPSPDWIQTDDLPDRIKKMRAYKDVAIIAGNGNIFETSWYMRGFAQMLEDLILEPELACEIMTRVTDYFIGYFERILQAAEGMIDIIFTADDIGQQEGLLVSPELWERMIKPHHMRLNKAIHNYGVKIMYHSDGAVMRAVPGLIDMGIDVLEALQFDAKGMDPVLLKREYGDKLCFHGGVSVQSTLPFGTPEDVEREVDERIRVLGREGGYILAPSHAIQAGTPPENVVAFLNVSR